MPTLYDYIASLSVGGEPVVWSDGPIEPEQIPSDQRPYVVVERLNERADEPLYGVGNVIAHAVDINIYQAPDENNRAPSLNEAYELYYALLDAPNTVDAWIYGQDLIAMHYVMSIPPDYDEDTGGNFGAIRFRLFYARGA